MTSRLVSSDFARITQLPKRSLHLRVARFLEMPELHV